MQVTSNDITIIGKLVYDLCGIVLDESKGYLIESRLSRLAQQAGCLSFADLRNRIVLQHDNQLANRVIDAITTQETMFFRDTSPFNALQFKVIPDLVDLKMQSGGLRRLRIWSAACSTGQEPYSIAISLREILPDIHRWDIKILATDISDAAIRQASLGYYQPHEIQRGLKPALLNKYFLSQNPGWKIRDEIRAYVTFRRLNLLQPLVGLGSFDIIFCRNVAIYFNPEDRRRLFLGLTRLLSPHGYLFVGSSELLSNLGPRFLPQNYCQSIFYQPNRTHPVPCAV
ncbi:MAG: protein-glutamate O-methyltransferase CheR [Sedimentisphaerales bacterium]|nr:protein-glutamate O-methyltransferase CheR [Sedimentisphaerales bacterium]